MERNIQKYKYKLIIILRYSLIFVVISCTKEADLGILHVRSLSPGTYEIYKINKKRSKQIISEKIGEYNKDKMLSPGEYLVMAECSSRNIIIEPGKKSELFVHTLKFNTPIKPQYGDLFSLQCMHEGKKNSRQNFVNTFSLNLFPQKAHLLVNLSSLDLDLSQHEETPQIITYDLAAFRVMSNMKNSVQVPYFVTPHIKSLSITQAQKLNRWLFLLPGDYQVSLSGTKSRFSLTKGEKRTIQAAYLQVKLPSKRLLNLFTEVSGRPFDLFIYKSHLISFNEIYPVIPMEHKIIFDHSQEPATIQTKQNKLSKITAHSIMVDRGCSPWEWECIGKKEVFVFAQGMLASFYVGKTDAPIIYHQNKIALSMRSSKGIFFYIDSKTKKSVLKTGTIVLKPVPILHPHKVTELIRIEARKKPLYGHSQDVSFTRNTKMMLFEGDYFISSYVRINNKDDQKKVNKKIVRIKGHQNTEYEFPYFVSKKKYEAMFPLYLKEKQQALLRKREKQYSHNLLN